MSCISLKTGADIAGQALLQLCNTDGCSQALSSHKPKSLQLLPQGGATIEQLRQSTQAHIKIERETPGCLERLICISSATGTLEPQCRAQEALLCVQDRLVGADTAELVHMVRIKHIVLWRGRQ